MSNTISNSIVTSHKLQRLLGAAANIQTLMSNGTLTAAWGEGDADQGHAAVTAFDTLTEAAAQVQAEQKAASPFLRYRREIMADTPAGARLRLLVLNLYSEAQAVSLRRIFEYCDEHNTRVALECIAHFAIHGDRDSQFMGMAMEIAEAASNEPSEVAA